VAEIQPLHLQVAGIQITYIAAGRANPLLDTQRIFCGCSVMWSLRHPFLQEAG
jgi:hypothetical protein